MSSNSNFDLFGVNKENTVSSGNLDIESSTSQDNSLPGVGDLVSNDATATTSSKAGSKKSTRGKRRTDTTERTGATKRNKG